MGLKHSLLSSDSCNLHDMVRTLLETTQVMSALQLETLVEAKMMVYEVL